jgi:hypothetical protein
MLRVWIVGLRGESVRYHAFYGWMEEAFDAARTDLRDFAVLVASFDLDHDAWAAEAGLTDGAGRLRWT